ncbi:hypothetical protein I6J59_08085 [Butyricimonas virosa]|uniref:RHS repeat-associated core domain-containing protein n=2 Tax=Butyricimonas virosa TaxID=544645 RepID=A0ABX7H905_9BACT|nr:RHS repeat-associated core domain-containing protein [Butyricimonas virosa]QRO51545.1 hypothetical protein I6J59_08085 [Butyricimonas virosa]
MTNDSRRALDFGYNVLNLLSEVKTVGGELKAKYDYLADGTKLRVRDKGEVNGFDYLGSLTYRKSGAGLQLESASFGDGEIRPGASNGGQGEVNYFLTDHLGSVRVIVDGTGKVLERNDYYPLGARQARSDYPQLAANRFKYNGKEEQVTGDLEWLDYGARMYDSGLGRWFGVDPFQESFISLSPYNYCSGNPMVFIDPSGALVTHYVDKDYNVLLNTDDGSDDVVVVPDEYVGDFKKFASFYSDPGLAPVYNSKGWNSYWKNKFGLAERQLSELELAVSDLYSGKDGKNKAIAYFLSHQGSDLLAAAWSETWYHLRSIESWVDGLLMGLGVGRVTVTSKVTRKSLIKVPVGRSENIMSSVARNSPVIINGVKFTGHALDQMQARGIISPTAVLDVVKNPARVFLGNQPGTMVFIRDNLKIVTNRAGDIVTVIWQ